MRVLRLPQTLNLFPHYQKMRLVFLRKLAMAAYHPFLPSENLDQQVAIREFLVKVWEHLPAKSARLYTGMALGSLMLRSLGFSSTRGPYPVRLLFYAVRGQALLALYFPVKPNFTLRTVKTSSCARGEYDYVIIGSGAAGASAAEALSKKGKEVVILEEGSWLKRENFQPSTLFAIHSLFRNQGMQFAHGKSLIPVLQGSCVGGTTVINGAIAHPLPRQVYEEWARDKGIADSFSWEEIENVSNSLAQDLSLKRNIDLEFKSLPLHQALEKLNWKHASMLRNAPLCESSGRCLQGCPTGGKLSMERSFIPTAIERGATVLANHQVIRILTKGKKAVGVVVRSQGTEHIIYAKKAILLAAGAIHSPQLLKKSGIHSFHLGRHFQCHLSVSSVARLSKPVREIEGPPQGVEVTEFEAEGIKLATQLLPPELLLSRAGIEGTALLEALEKLSHYSSWTSSIRSEAEGDLKLALNPKIYFEPSQHDLERLRFSLNKMEELFHSLGAEQIYPGIMEGMGSDNGWLSSRPLFLGIGHVFGTCRMGSDPAHSVVGPEFKVHGFDNLYCVDASIFPTNTGVNPQHAIMTLARLAAQEFV